MSQWVCGNYLEDNRKHCLINVEVGMWNAETTTFRPAIVSTFRIPNSEFICLCHLPSVICFLSSSLSLIYFRNLP
jgi:hypothetical protein